MMAALTWHYSVRGAWCNEQVLDFWLEWIVRCLAIECQRRCVALRFLRVAFQAFQDGCAWNLYKPGGRDPSGPVKIWTVESLFFCMVMFAPWHPEKFPAKKRPTGNKNTWQFPGFFWVVWDFVGSIYFFGKLLDSANFCLNNREKSSSFQRGLCERVGWELLGCEGDSYWGSLVRIWCWTFGGLDSTGDEKLGQKDGRMESMGDIFFKGGQCFTNMAKKTW